MAYIKILVLEDNPSDAELMIWEVEKAGFICDWKRVDKEEDFLSELNNKPDIILADYSLPQFTAMHALKHLKNSNLDIPFIVVTGTIGEEAAVECIKNGASDYLIKDRLNRLGHSIEQELSLKKIREEKALTDKALIISEEKYRNLFESSPIGMFKILVNEDKILTINKAFINVLGYEHIEEIKDEESFFPISNMEVYKFEENKEKLINLLKINNKINNFKSEYIKKDGTTITLLINANYNPEDDIIEGSIIDISKETEIEKRLIEAKQKAEDANMLKSMFLANVSHELKTPLNSILGYSQLLISDKGMPNELNEFAKSIFKSGTYLLSLIAELLDMSKMDIGILQINKEGFYIQKMLDEITMIFSEPIKQKKLRFEINIAKDFPQKIHSDRTRLMQILINLIGNSIKFTTEGSVVLKVSLSNEAKILFTVKDTGIGIPEEKKDLVFEAFTQLEYYMTRKHGGTGVGLAISKKLVNLLGGEIWFESTLNCGSTFYFTIPI